MFEGGTIVKVSDLDPVQLTGLACGSQTPTEVTRDYIAHLIITGPQRTPEGGASCHCSTTYH